MCVYFKKGYSNARLEMDRSGGRKYSSTVSLVRVRVRKHDSSAISRRERNAIPYCKLKDWDGNRAQLLREKRSLRISHW